MNTRSMSRPSAAALGVVLAGASLCAQDQDNPFRPFDRAAFEAHAKKLGANDEQMAAFARDVEEVSMEAAADGLLRKLFPAYGNAVDLAEAGEPRAALALTQVLAETEDPYLRGHCRYHLGRVFLDGDDPEQAADIFAAYLRGDRNKTPLDAEVMYFYGYALADIPTPQLAIQALSSFLKLFPNAPERYIATATQLRAELESQLDSPLHDIADVLKGVERRIRKTDTGKDTQHKQEDVMAKLKKIIEEIEKQEKLNSGGPGGLNKPMAPASRSAAPPGKTRFGNLNKVAGVADRWGNAKDRDRKEVENDLQTKLPGHYRRMLEEYYRKLGAGQ